MGIVGGTPSDSTTVKGMNIYAVIKVNEPSIRNIWRGLPLTHIVVRMQDLLGARTGKFNTTYWKIVSSGGIHRFLGFQGKIILSSIMRDYLLLKCTKEQYAQAIQALKPDFYLTPDGETYRHEEKLSDLEINRCLEETAWIMEACPNSKPIGLVKGCTRSQVLRHVLRLQFLGIQEFAFHTGDFTRYGRRDTMNEARQLASLIKKQTNNLMLCGTGSQKRLLEYSFADTYATLNYFVLATKGKKIQGNKLVSCRYSKQLVRHNLQMVLLNASRTRHQTRLFDGGDFAWAVAFAAAEKGTQQPDTAFSQIEP